MSISTKIKKIKSSPQQLKFIEQKAIDRGIPLEEAIRGDAGWMFERNWSWHSGKKK